MDHTNCKAPQDALHSLGNNASDRLHKGIEQCHSDEHVFHWEMCGEVGRD